MKIPQFTKKEDLFMFLKKHKHDLIASKKFSIKEADSIFHTVGLACEKGDVIKEEVIKSANIDNIRAKVVINTTNLLDSHGDVHMPGIWNKSIKESKNLYLLQEHKMQFDKVIADTAKASIKSYTWLELGYPEYSGQTQALVFDAEIKSARNDYMFNQYLNGYVKNHSVGMQYVNLFLCMNSDDKYYKEEKDNWDKYINEVANKQDAIDAGHFWAVTEAKIIEGSAVVKGSNYATPTISITEAGKSTSETTEPPEGTQAKVNYTYITNNFNLNS